MRRCSGSTAKAVVISSCAFVFIATLGTNSKENAEFVLKAGLILCYALIYTGLSYPRRIIVRNRFFERPRGDSADELLHVDQAAERIV